MTPYSIQEAGYLISENRDLSFASRQGYGKVIEKFLRFLSQEGVDLWMPITELPEEHFLKFAESLLPREISSREDISHLRTATFKLSAIHQWLKLLEASQMHPPFCRECFCKKLTAMRPKAEAPRVVVDTIELKRFVEFVRNLNQPEERADELRQAKIKAIVFFLRDTGVRVSEVAGLHKRDLDLQHRTANIYRRKGRDVTVSFSPETAALLTSYWELRGDGENSRGLPAFSGRESPRCIQRHISPRTVEDLFAKLCADAGVTHITPHTFRHAVRIAEEKRILRKIMYPNSP